MCVHVVCYNSIEDKLKFDHIRAISKGKTMPSQCLSFEFNWTSLLMRAQKHKPPLQFIQLLNSVARLPTRRYTVDVDNTEGTSFISYDTVRSSRVIIEYLIVIHYSRTFGTGIGRV